MKKREVSIQHLQGVLTMPEGRTSVPAILILPGSGAVDRDGKFPGAQNNSLQLLGDALAAKGIASLRIDKRGVGGSRSIDLREDELRFQTFVEDAVAWARFLKGQARFASVGF